jgi:preprotein translocase subunit SecY
MGGGGGIKQIIQGSSVQCHISTTEGSLQAYIKRVQAVSGDVMTLICALPSAPPTCGTCNGKFPAAIKEERGLS